MSLIWGACPNMALMRVQVHQECGWATSTKETDSPYTSSFLTNFCFHDGLIWLVWSQVYMLWAVRARVRYTVVVLTHTLNIVKSIVVIRVYFFSCFCDRVPVEYRVLSQFQSIVRTVWVSVSVDEEGTNVVEFLNTFLIFVYFTFRILFCRDEKKIFWAKKRITRKYFQEIFQWKWVWNLWYQSDNFFWNI